MVKWSDSMWIVPVVDPLVSAKKNCCSCPPLAVNEKLFLPSDIVPVGIRSLGGGGGEPAIGEIGSTCSTPMPAWPISPMSPVQVLLPPMFSSAPFWLMNAYGWTNPIPATLMFSGTLSGGLVGVSGLRCSAAPTLTNVAGWTVFDQTVGPPARGPRSAPSDRLFSIVTHPCWMYVLPV